MRGQRRGFTSLQISGITLASLGLAYDIEGLGGHNCDCVVRGEDGSFVSSLEPDKPEEKSTDGLNQAMRKDCLYS